VKGINEESDLELVTFYLDRERLERERERLGISEEKFGERGIRLAPPSRLYTQLCFYLSLLLMHRLFTPPHHPSLSSSLSLSKSVTLHKPKVMQHCSINKPLTKPINMLLPQENNNT
jgi:hypothetical protein